MNKTIIVSIPPMHDELYEAIKVNATKERMTISQYVRTLLYKALDGKHEATSGVDAPRAQGSVGDSVWQADKA